LSTITAHPIAFAALFLLFVIAIGLLLVWIAEKSPARALLQKSAGVVAPFSNLLALLFGLFAAFLANDVSIHADRAHAAVTREANAVAVVLSIADGLGERGRTLKQLAIDYGRHSIGPQWRSLQQTARADALGLKMLHEVLFGGLAGADMPVRQAASTAIMDLRAARSEMTAIAHSRTGWLKWQAVFIFGILTQIGVVVVHLGKPRAMVLATILFAVGMAFMLWVVLIRLDPFAGKNAVSLAPIGAAYRAYLSPRHLPHLELLVKPH
jgi:hypothetical protein